VLALQNLQGEEVFGHCDHEQTEMVEGLHGSLTMMEKVLNDVLSFNRMESGRVGVPLLRGGTHILMNPAPQFTQARKPFHFSKSVQIVILSHRAQALAGNLYLHCELDPEIDRLGGRFMGDEMRLRQVMSNFTSNALKFTTEGGIKVVTKLLFPRMESSAQTPDQEYSEAEKARNDSVVSSEKSSPFNIETPGGTQIQLNQLEKGSQGQANTRISEKQAFSGHLPPNNKAAQPGQKAIIRVEVHDTGVGLHPKDVKDNKLFSPYTQT
jgi:signal transduction histidine kinase